MAGVQILKPGHLLPGADAAPQHRLLGGGVVSGGRFLFAGFLSVTMLAANTMPAFAATTVWEKANEIMKDVYTQILTISTIAAVVTAAIALLMMNFSKSGRTVDEARAWLKRIIITWAILNGLGFILAYITPFFSGGKWNG